MAKVFDARLECPFEEREILFDTNVWIAIYGNDPTRDRAAYSEFYSSAMTRNNDIVTSELVLFEFFNRMCKIEYEILFGKENWRDFKIKRKNDDEFIERVESVRDTCLNILDECKLFNSDFSSGALGACFNEAALGKLDTTDAALVDLCRTSDLIFVSHDRDFECVDFNLVTANPSVLRNAGL